MQVNCKCCSSVQCAVCSAACSTAVQYQSPYVPKYPSAGVRVRMYIRFSSRCLVCLVHFPITQRVAPPPSSSKKTKTCMSRLFLSLSVSL